MAPRTCGPTRPGRGSFARPGRRGPRVRGARPRHARKRKNAQIIRGCSRCSTVCGEFVCARASGQRAIVRRGGERAGARDGGAAAGSALPVGAWRSGPRVARVPAPPNDVIILMVTLIMVNAHSVLIQQFRGSQSAVDSTPYRALASAAYTVWNRKMWWPGAALCCSTRSISSASSGFLSLDRKHVCQRANSAGQSAYVASRKYVSAWCVTAATAQPSRPVRWQRSSVRCEGLPYTCST
jgi:hypothetical protein